jgi:predicted dehydrogenase
MRRYALAGASGRALSMYGLPVARRYAATTQLVGVFDPNQTRAAYVAGACGGAPTFRDFDAMLREARPDTVVVTTVDRYHHEYIIRALEAGCQVITEKPMTVDAEKVRAILAAEQRAGRPILVTFNYRFNPYMTRAKELVQGGAIGRPLSVDFEWLLDRQHGADYFRRWHGRKENSGGLLVHKASHHFDLINWWLEDEPSLVFAVGARRFYGPTRAERGERCSTCAHTRTCEFYVDFAAQPLKRALYFEAEHEDGYWRDRCVFSDQIDIEDTMSVTVRYAGGAQLAYSLIAHAAYEGWRAAINGTGGRLELFIPESGDPARAPAYDIRLYDARGVETRLDLPKDDGEHGGGDARLLERLFGPLSQNDRLGRPDPFSQPDPLGHLAGSRAGALSALIGIAANTSIATGQPVSIANLLAPG